MIQIELISDFICPWCYIGRSRLERIISDLEKKVIVEVGLVPFLLYPGIPVGGLPKRAFRSKSKPGMGKALKEEARKEGLQLNYHKIDRIPNSFEAHRLVHLCDSHMQNILAKDIFLAHFEKGKNIGEPEVLIDIAKRRNVDKDLIADYMQSDMGKQECLNKIESEKAVFISTVPSLRFNAQLVVPGLQSDDTWKKYILRADTHFAMLDNSLKTF